MEIKSFVRQSLGEWGAMRSGHSLAFKQFEEVTSNISIRLLENDDRNLQDFLNRTDYPNSNFVTPFEINWTATSDWKESNKEEELNGSSIFIPIEYSTSTGIILRSKGYAEKEKAISEYLFLSDGTLVLTTIYEQLIAEERIWFISPNVRCRSSVIKSINKNAILQTSFTSEIRKLG